MCNLRFQQIYWGFQRFCPQIVFLRLIAHPQGECAKKREEAPPPAPPWGGGEDSFAGALGLYAPPQGGAGGGASLLARPLVACKARTPNARFLHQCQQKCVFFAADMLRGIPREGRRNESPPRRGRRKTMVSTNRLSRGTAPGKADGMKAPGGGDGLQAGASPL